MSEAIAVTVPDEAWEPNYFTDHNFDDQVLDERVRLYASLRINGVPFHLEALEIESIMLESDTVQRTKVYDEDAALIHGAVGADGPWQTMTIAGRDYVVWATPFCD